MLRWCVQKLRDGSTLLLGLMDHRKDLVEHVRKTGIRDISIDSLIAFLGSINVEQDGIFLPHDKIDSYVEQYAFRKQRCPDCRAENGGCPHCECVFPLKMQTPEQHCPQFRWEEMLTPEEWGNYKKIHGL